MLFIDAGIAVDGDQWPTVIRREPAAERLSNRLAPGPLGLPFDRRQTSLDLFRIVYEDVWQMHVKLDRP